MNIGANTTEKRLVFGFDTGLPLLDTSHETYRFNLGEPTETFDIGTMVPTNPTEYFISDDTYHSNLHGTVWDWTYYPNDNVSTEGGMEWDPHVEGPTFKGAWKMKKRPGGNSESNFSGTPPGTIDDDADYTVSVMCKTTQASCFRIHLNTTKNGSSYWGYASSQHSGGGDWEKLSITIPSGSGNTALNVIRCQANGTTVNADAYYRDYQVEKRSHGTPFILGGSRSPSGSLLDITGNNEIDLTNASFSDTSQLRFNGTGDNFKTKTSCGLTGSITLEAVFKEDGSTAPHTTVLCTDEGHQYGVKLMSYKNNNRYGLWLGFGTSSYVAMHSEELVNDKIYHLVASWDQSSGDVVIYLNGVKKATVETGQTGNISLNNGLITVGRDYHGSGGGYSLDGQVYLGKIYDGVLNHSEVLQNYNAIKTRFNL